MDRTLYDVLELSQNASNEAIRAAYTRLSAKFDPDSTDNQGNSDARVQYLAVKEAFLTLGNPQKRKQYDLTLVKQSLSQYAVETPRFWTPSKLVLLAILICIAAGWYIREQRLQAIAAEQRAIAEEKRKAAEALAKAEAEHAKAEALKLQQERMEAARRNSESYAMQQTLRRLSSEQLAADRQQEALERQRMSNRYNEDVMRRNQAAREQRATEARARQQLYEDRMRLEELERQRGGRVTTIPR